MGTMLEGKHRSAQAMPNSFCSLGLHAHSTNNVFSTHGEKEGGGITYYNGLIYGMLIFEIEVKCFD